MFRSEIAGFIVGFSWALELLIQPPWQAVYSLWSNFATFSYGERLLQWFPYSIASTVFGVGYIAAGALFYWLGTKALPSSKKQDPHDTEATKSRATPRVLFGGLLLLIGGLAVLVGFAAFASGFISATVAFINGTIMFFSK